MCKAAGLFGKLESHIITTVPFIGQPNYIVQVKQSNLNIANNHALLGRQSVIQISMLRISPCVLYREKIELNSLILLLCLPWLHGVHGCANMHGAGCPSL